jgi:hypothetical protein
MFIDDTNQPGAFEVHSFWNERGGSAAPDESRKFAANAKEFCFAMTDIWCKPRFFVKEGVEVVGLGQSLSIVPKGRM